MIAHLSFVMPQAKHCAVVSHLIRVKNAGENIKEVMLKLGLVPSHGTLNDYRKRTFFSTV